MCGNAHKGGRPRWQNRSCCPNGISAPAFREPTFESIEATLATIIVDRGGQREWFAALPAARKRILIRHRPTRPFIRSIATPQCFCGIRPAGRVSCGEERHPSAIFFRDRDRDAMGLLFPGTSRHQIVSSTRLVTYERNDEPARRR